MLEIVRATTISTTWDIGIFENDGDTKKQDKAYTDLGAMIKVTIFGLEWGGDWTSFVDKPHHQLVTASRYLRSESFSRKERASSNSMPNVFGLCQPILP